MLEVRRKTNLVESGQTQPTERSVQRSASQSTQSGFTIVEALVALIIAAVLLTAIAPLVVLAVGSRLQARRVDLATQAARGYIDGLRSDAIGPPTNDNARFTQPNPPGRELGVPAPNGLAKAFGVEECLDKNLNPLVRFNNTPDCNNPDAFLVVQAFRNPPQPPTTDPAQIKQQGYCVGVRVYRADAFQGGAPTKTQPIKSNATSGLGAKNYPLVVMRAEIINQTSYENYQKRFVQQSQNPPVAGATPQPKNPCT